jgi:hypothetical protein
MLTDQVAKLPKVKVHHVEIKLFGRDNIYATSFSIWKLIDFTNQVIEENKDRYQSSRTWESMVAETWESDDNYIHDTVASFKNFLK